MVQIKKEINELFNEFSKNKRETSTIKKELMTLQIELHSLENTDIEEHKIFQDDFIESHTNTIWTNRQNDNDKWVVLLTNLEKVGDDEDTAHNRKSVQYKYVMADGYKVVFKRDGRHVFRLFTFHDSLNINLFDIWYEHITKEDFISMCREAMKTIQDI